jgi:hypothetical protein
VTTAISSQAGLFDRTLDDEKLATEIEGYLETIVSAKQAMKIVAKARKRLREKTPDLNLKDGDRLRIGRFVIEGRDRAGGGIEIPAWRKTIIGRIQTLE